MNYLLDTNIWLERLLDQEKSAVVGKLLESLPLEQIFISDFSLHSIGIILSKFKRYDVLSVFIADLFGNGYIRQLSIEVDDYLNLISNMKTLKLDFDDAYQLTLSQKHDLIIITFDKDFNAKGIQKTSPEKVLEELDQ